MGRVQRVRDRSRVTGLCSRVFSTMDPNSFPFGTPSGLPFAGEYLRGAVFRTRGYRLERAQYRAVVEASRVTGDSGFFIGCAEDPDKVCVWPTIDAHAMYWCEYPDYGEYQELLPLVETFIVSPSTAWGVLLSQEDYGFLAGSDEFVAGFSQKYDWKRDLEWLAGDFGEGEAECDEDGVKLVQEIRSKQHL